MKMDEYDKGILYLDLTRKEEGTPGETRKSRFFSPVTDILENEKGLFITLELPGVKADAVTVTVSGTRLSVQGFKDKEAAPEGAVLLCMERNFGNFRKDFEIVGAFNTHGLRASLTGGILSIVIPRCQEMRGRKIKIEIETES